MSPTFNRETVNPSPPDQCEGCKKLRAYAETEYSNGYKVGSLTSHRTAQTAWEIVEKEREGRLQDNHVFTTEIERLEEVIRDLELRVKDSERR